ncbi:putative secreted protein (Por secretion system target) [Winogradskyella arenosi]|uniref:Putative secreted protein (Por secretion system target) n=2 Tax=Winogradskyella arenosi TaxID=533325 RepID=A0A368ZF44_9FLAO|nr:putative secreted protein (Por secretion system target) [Winogradskyella arenosi]
MKKLPLLFLIPFLSLNCLLLQAQDGTFTNNNGTGDGNWSTATNWTGGIIAGDTGIATLEASVDLETSSITVKEIVIGGSDITVSNGTLTIANTTNNNSIGNNVANTTTTFNCNLIFDTTKRIRNVATSTLVFASEKTVTFGSNNINLNNLSDTNPIEFHGSVSGTGTLGLRGRILLGSDSNFTGFIGTFNFAGNNAAKLIVNSTNNINSSITCEANASSEVLFNTNQNSIGNLSVTTALALNFDSTVTAVQFSGTGTMTGVVDLKNYTSGVLKIGTSIPHTVLDTWLVDGVASNGTIVQDIDGSIIIPTYASKTGTVTNLDWDSTTTWVGGNVPPSDTDEKIYIKGNLNIDSDVSVKNITILNDGAVTVNPGKSLTVSGEAITSDNLFAESSATSFSSLIFNGTVTGEVGYNRWVHTTPSNDLISAPVPETFGDIEASLLANPATLTQRAFGPFDNVSGSYVNWDTSTNGSDPLVQGKGYRAARASEDGTILFQGAPVSPAVDVVATLSDGGNTTYGLWNLIGNPYPSYLDFDEFWTENSGQLNGGSGAYQAVYGYSGYANSSDNWTVWNNIETNNGYKITPGQGFFVKTTASGGTVTFTPAMRTTGSSDDFIVGRTATPNHVLSELFLSRESSQHSTKIYFVDNQTRGLDPGYDAAAFTGSSSPIYTHLVENNENIKFAIQALPYNDFNEVVVPLGVNAEAGTQLTIGMNPEKVSIPETVTVYLEDNLTNTWTLLNNSDYVFTPSDALNGTGRFYVHFSATTLSTDDALINGLHIYSNQASKTVVIKGQLLADTTAVLYDMQGRSVFQQVLTSSNTTQTLNVSSLKAGVYIVALKTPTQNKTQKIIIK